jgi:hypothetical protein
MKLGAFYMTHILSISHVSGNLDISSTVKVLPAQEQRQGYVGGSACTRAKTRLCWRFSLMLMVSSTIIQEGHTVIKEMYVKILHHFRYAVKRKHPEKWEQNS